MNYYKNYIICIFG